MLSYGGRTVGGGKGRRAGFSRSPLPAYHYARDFTSRRFQVLLYCPDDSFCVSMIAGAGVAHQKIKIPVNHRPHWGISIPIKTRLSRFNGVVLPTGFDDARRHLAILAGMAPPPNPPRWTGGDISTAAIPRAGASNRGAPIRLFRAGLRDG